jgi:hypothetical protein
MLQKEYEPVHKPINFSLLANCKTRRGHSAMSSPTRQQSFLTAAGGTEDRVTVLRLFFRNSSAKRMLENDR